MTLHFKTGGAWTTVNRPYIKRSGVWTPVNQVWRKAGGVWVQHYNYDVTPPDTPTLSLEIVEHYSTASGSRKVDGRWIKVGVRMPDASHSTELKRIRVLTTYNGAPPTTQYGGQYTATQDRDYPGEPWSEWRYNSFGQHQDSTAFVYKQWTPNPGTTTMLAGGKYYHFGAWAEDLSGNWSAGQFLNIYMPKAGVTAENIVIREARFNPNTSGSWVSGSGVAAGPLVQSYSPQSRGIWLYGNQITDNIASRGPATIRNAQIRVDRDNDNGEPTANVFIFRHNYATSGAVPTSGATFSEVVKLGTINKGESKWFDLPTAYHADLAAKSIKGFGLHFKNPDFAAGMPADYSVVKSQTDSPRCGELHVVWEEVQ